MQVFRHFFIHTIGFSVGIEQVHYAVWKLDSCRVYNQSAKGFFLNTTTGLLINKAATKRTNFQAEKSLLEERKWLQTNWFNVQLLSPEMNALIIGRAYQLIIHYPHFLSKRQ